MQVCKTITLRTRKCRGGMLSYYLDYYPFYRDKDTMKTVRHESLGIYIYEFPQNRREMEFNRTMYEKAETIRCRKFEMVVNERYNLTDKAHQQEDFLAYYEKIALKHNQRWLWTYKHFCAFVNEKCTFGEVDIDLCNGFLEYLQEDALNSHTGKKLHINSASSYWVTFKSLLRTAFVSKQIQENLSEFLPNIGTIATTKESLSIPEIERLYSSECKFDVLKRAALFSCFTGLRYSDVKELTWNNVKEYDDGSRYLDFISVKTKRQNIVPINNDVIHLMGQESTGVVFKGFNKEMTRGALKEWMEKAKIRKHITFHCFRHTYATLQIELGTDIYTVQSLLAHSNVSTTQIYARHSDAKKREAAQRLSFDVLKNVSREKKTKESEINDKQTKR